MNDTVLYDSCNRIATITINRPARLNAINEEVEQGLAEAWRRFNASEDRVAIITGSGDKAFSVGKDLDYDATPDYRRFIPGFDIQVSKPIIAAIGGWCIGGALTLVQMCDLCVATENTVFTYPEPKLGFAGGMIVGMASRIPHKVAMEVMLLGEELSAQRAYEIGFVNKVVGKGEHLAAAQAYAERLAGNAPMVLSMLKDLARECVGRSPMEQASHTMYEVERVMGSTDRIEGMRSFLEKRPANFQGN